MAGIADMWLEETRTLRICRLRSSVHWWSLTQRSPGDAIVSKSSVTNPLATSPEDCSVIAGVKVLLCMVGYFIWGQ